MPPKTVAKRKQSHDDDESESPTNKKTFTGKDGVEYQDVQIGRGVLMVNKSTNAKAPKYQGPCNLWISNEAYTIAAWQRQDGGLDFTIKMKKKSYDSESQ